MRTDMLVQAEFELRVIRERTNLGIRQAKKDGRWINRAPYGYLNKTEEGKPVIVVDPVKSKIVQQIFKLFADGTKMNEISRKVNGYSVKGHSRLTKMLKNPAYVGLISSEGQLIKGRHEAIVDINTFNQVQTYFRKETNIKVLINDEVPLRGVLRCSCGRLLTAGKSKGKTRHYWYYKCQSHLEVNLNATKIHEQIKQVLFNISLSPQTIDRIKARAETIIKKNLKTKYAKVPDLKRSIGAIEKKILSLEEKFIANQLTFNVYSDWNAAYNTELSALRTKLSSLTETDLNVWRRYENVSHKLTNLQGVYEAMRTPEKHKLLNIVFNKTLMYQLNSFLTYNILPEFASKALMLKEKGLLIINSPSHEMEITPFRTRKGNIVELFELLEAV